MQNGVRMQVAEFLVRKSGIAVLASLNWYHISMFCFVVVNQRKRIKSDQCSLLGQKLFTVYLLLSFGSVERTYNANCVMHLWRP